MLKVISFNIVKEKLWLILIIACLLGVRRPPIARSPSLRPRARARARTQVDGFLAYRLFTNGGRIGKK